MLSILIVPAASALPLAYEKVVEGVSSRGYDIQALHTPCVGLETGARGEPPTMYDDAAFIAARVTALADAGKDVLLVTHSYGGCPASESVKGLSKTQRESEGKTGGVVGLAFMTSLVPEVGKPAMMGSPSPLMEIGDDGWFYYPSMDLAASIVFSDIPHEEGLRWSKTMVKHSAVSFSNPLTYAGYNDVPVSYLVAEGDRSVPAERQRAYIDMIERVSGNKVDVSTTPAGHVPSVTAPADVIDWVLSVAEKLS